jgi:hypothetical protein
MLLLLFLLSSLLFCCCLQLVSGGGPTVNAFAVRGRSRYVKSRCKKDFEGNISHCLGNW